MELYASAARNNESASNRKVCLRPSGPTTVTSHSATPKSYRSLRLVFAFGGGLEIV
jgi:hypothetical protein